MSNALEGRVARLERAFTQAVGISLADHDDPEQAAARAKKLKADKEAAARLANEQAIADKAVAEYKAQLAAEQAAAEAEAAANAAAAEEKAALPPGKDA